MEEGGALPRRRHGDRKIVRFERFMEQYLRIRNPAALAAGFDKTK
jgi:hypothetical protein